MKIVECDMYLAYLCVNGCTWGLTLALIEGTKI